MFNIRIFSPSARAIRQEINSIAAQRDPDPYDRIQRESRFPVYAHVDGPTRGPPRVNQNHGGLMWNRYKD